MSFTKNILLLIVSPNYAWEHIGKYNVPIKIMQSKVFYPLLAVLAITPFAMLIYKDDVEIAFCIQKAIIDFTKFFLGYHLCSYILTGFFPSIVSTDDAANKVNTAILYNLVILILLNIINNLLPTPWLFIWIFYLYVFVVSLNSAEYVGVKRNSLFLYIMAGFAIIFPFFIEYILSLSLSFTLTA